MGLLQYRNGKLSISRSGLRIVLIAVLLSVITAWAISAIPEGAQVISVGAPETRTSPSPENVTGDGGNITEVNISIATQTTRWQGFFGDVNGSIVLEDTSGDLFYSWNVSNTSGEVYASVDNSINFANIFPENNCSVPNYFTGTGYDDSANETYFNNTNLAVTVGSVVINASTACAMTTYVSSSPSEHFNSLLLTDDSNDVTDAGRGGNTTVYASLIEDGATGFDGGTHDYQLLVPINTTTGITVYYFYAEIG